MWMLLLDFSLSSLAPHFPGRGHSVHSGPDLLTVLREQLSTSGEGFALEGEFVSVYARSNSCQYQQPDYDTHHQIAQLAL